MKLSRQKKYYEKNRDLRHESNKRLINLKCFITMNKKILYFRRDNISRE